MEKCHRHPANLRVTGRLAGSRGARPWERQQEAGRCLGLDTVNPDGAAQRTLRPGDPGGPSWAQPLPRAGLMRTEINWPHGRDGLLCPTLKTGALRRAGATSGPGGPVPRLGTHGKLGSQADGCPHACSCRRLRAEGTSRSRPPGLWSWAACPCLGPPVSLCQAGGGQCGAGGEDADPAPLLTAWRLVDGDPSHLLRI